MRRPRSGYQVTYIPVLEVETRMVWKMIARWAVMAIAVPLAAVGARRLSQAVESRRGSSRVTRLLRQSADALQGVTRQSQRRRRWWR
ncbi:MAG TPA: hypothetical protein VFM55_16385 [Micromonosporaceae bacterium]|nr:hypothetical protein [Micromonosporaceae bacterium]